MATKKIRIEKIADYGQYEIVRIRGQFFVRAPEGAPAYEAGAAHYDAVVGGASRQEVKDVLPRALKNFYAASQVVAALVRDGSLDASEYATAVEDEVQKREKGKRKLKFTPLGRRASMSCNCITPEDEK